MSISPIVSVNCMANFDMLLCLTTGDELDYVRRCPKLTVRVAPIFGLGDRGLIRPGFAADMAIFDPEATINTLEPEYVQDLPGNETRMIQRAVGTHHTVVNGEMVIENGAAMGAYPGQVLRPHTMDRLKIPRPSAQLGAADFLSLSRSTSTASSSHGRCVRLKLP